MPHYDYECKSCEHRFDLVSKMVDNKLPESKPCPECNELNVKQIITGIRVGDPFALGKVKLGADMKAILDTARRVPGASQKPTKFENM